MKSKVRNNALAGISFALLLGACSHDDQSVAQRQDAIKVALSSPVKEAAAAIRVTGQLAASETAIISTRVMGYINRIHVSPGDKVAQGQLLMSISNEDILARKGQARAMLTEAEAALKDAKKDFDRYTQLHQQQSASEKELENVTLHYRALQSRAEAARQMMHEADAMLAYTQIKAPFTGVITKKNADEGSMANPGMPLLVLEQLGSYRVHASVSELEITQVRPGAEAHITVKSNGRNLNGTVAEVSPSSSMSGGRYAVKIIVPAAETGGLYAGMHVSAEITPTESASASSTLLVPAAALIQKDQLVGLYTVSESQTALLRWVRTGRSFGDQIEVLSGLNENERFILSASGKLYNGAPVTQ